MQNTYNAKREVILEFEDSDDPKVQFSNVFANKKF